MRYVNQDGLTVDLFGRVVAHVSRLVPQATKKEPPTSATSGLSGSISSASAALQLSLVNKLKQQLDTAGSTLFKLTWKEKTTPAGRSVSLLRASALRTSGSDSGLWPTTLASGSRGSAGVGKRELPNAVKWIGWPTTSTRDHKGGYRGGAYERRQDQHGHAGCSSAVSGLANTQSDRSNTVGGIFEGPYKSESIGMPNFWANCDWLSCRDGKYRPVESGTFPLAHGATARVGRLRAYGNAIVPQAAQALIEAYLET